MLEITYWVNGKIVTAGAFQNQFPAKIDESYFDAVAVAVGAVRCRKHQKLADVSAKVEGREIRFSFFSCCPDADDAARIAIQQLS
ncbi:hypothetical protein SAMN05421753_12093 [Planctomicrobium piriforme]|uniref:Uncharacterized protein n=1 Tax=Planctomicrobium piriforme TaxID=1576369 RepID=A0A1I3RD72_9PLAN|nr:hypothetical protein SAMN05421753_12093 [Planctomicrobium piriforme]